MSYKIESHTTATADWNRGDTLSENISMNNTEQSRNNLPYHQYRSSANIFRNFSKNASVKRNTKYDRQIYISYHQKLIITQSSRLRSKPGREASLELIINQKPVQNVHIAQSYR